MPYETRIEKIDKDLVIEDKLEILKANPIIQLGAELLQQGEVVAFPTETVYGLGADATQKGAVDKIFKAKGRPQDNPLIVHIVNRGQLGKIIEGDLPLYGERLIEAFWPGPLTIIVAKNRLIPASTTAGLDSVAIRMPSHPVARALIEASSLPLAAPSANLSGFPSPTLAEHVWHDLKGRIPLIIDGGSCQVGVESTVIDIRGKQPIILRPGGITRDEIERVLGFEVPLAKGLKKGDKPLSPGMKYRHYSPKTPLVLIRKEEQDKLKELIKGYVGKKIALIITKETREGLDLLSDMMVVEIGSRLNPAGIASRLFAVLRQLDQKDLDLILVEAIPEQGIGEAIMNRLYKAASKK